MVVGLFVGIGGGLLIGVLLLGVRLVLILVLGLIDLICVDVLVMVEFMSRRVVVICSDWENGLYMVDFVSVLFCFVIVFCIEGDLMLGMVFVFCIEFMWLFVVMCR